MSKSFHPWCRDVQRDKAIRAAEDIEAAARVPLPDHRDLPQAVAELRERVARMEDLFFDANEMVTPPQPAPPPPADGRAICHIDTTDTIDERGWHEPVEPRMDRADGCRVGAVYPRPAAAGGADGASGAGDRGAAVSGLRTERVTFAITIQDGRQWGPQLDGVCGIVADYIGISRTRGESVRVVEDATIASGEAVAHEVVLNALVHRRKLLAAAHRGITRLTAERDAALRHIAATEQSRRDAIRERDAAKDGAEQLRRRLRDCESALKESDDHVATVKAELTRVRDSLNRLLEMARAERDAALRERDAAKARAAKYEETRQWNIEKIEDGCIRVCFGDHHRATDCEWEYFIPASREADLQNQRSGAIRERDEARADLATMRGKCDGLKDRVAELEAAAAPAAKAGGVSNPEPISGAGKPNCQGKLDSSPQPPRGWLTSEERALVESLRATFQQNADALRSAGPGGHVDNWERRVLLLDAILARSTPPKVQLPPEIAGVVYDAVSVRNAIRAAGGEVE